MDLLDPKGLHGEMSEMKSQNNLLTEVEIGYTYQNFNVDKLPLNHNTEYLHCHLV